MFIYFKESTSVVLITLCACTSGISVNIIHWYAFIAIVIAVYYDECKGFEPIW